MPKIIVASRYLKPAAKGTRGNLVKYIATRETVQKYSPKKKDIPVTENQRQLIMELLQINSDGKKLPEYSDYLKNPSKENASELLSELLEQSADMIADKEILVKYVAERPGVEKIGKHGLFSDSDDEIILAQAQKNIAEHQGNVWSHDISLTREDAERLGYTTPEMWRNLIMRHTDDIAKAQNIRLENLRWYAAFHNTAHHPHIHLLVYSTDIKEGFLTEIGIEQIKSAFANDIFHNELYRVYKKQTDVRDKLRSEAESVMRNLLSELKNSNEPDPQLEQLVMKLQSQLRNSKGKKSVKLGMPVALQDTLTGLAFLFIQTIINSFGLDVSAGLGMAEKINSFIWLIPSALMQSMSVFVAQNLGALRPDRAKKALRYGLLISIVIGIVFFYISFFHGDFLVQFFKKYPNVIAPAYDYLKATGICCLFSPMLFCFMGYYNGSGKTLFVMIQGLAGSFLVRIPVAYIMHGVEGTTIFHIGLGMPIAVFLQLLFSFGMYIYTEKKKAKQQV